MMTPSLLSGSWTSQLLLLLGEARYLQMGRRFRRGGAGVEPFELLIAFGVLVAVVAVTWLMVRYVNARAARRAHSPKLLFEELCRAHQLDWSSRRLLSALARAHRLQQPARLFVEPHRFEPNRLTGSLRTRREQVRALRERLFEKPLSESEEAKK